MDGGASEPLELPLEELEARITELCGHLNAAQYRWLVLIAEFDRRCGWGDGKLSSCAHWLNFKCGLNLGAAREKVRVAHALKDLPLIAGSMARGELSYSKVRALTRVACAATERDLLEIALHGTVGADGAPAFVERDAPVEADDVGAGFAEGGEERGGVDAEVDDGDAEGLDAADEFGGGAEAVVAVVLHGERAGPGVEDLDDVGAGGDLLGGEVGEDGDELVHEERPCGGALGIVGRKVLRVLVSRDLSGFFDSALRAPLRMTVSCARRPGAGGVHEFFGFDVVAGGATFDHVAGEGEGGSAETDDA